MIAPALVGSKLKCINRAKKINYHYKIQFHNFYIGECFPLYTSFVSTATASLRTSTARRKRRSSSETPTILSTRVMLAVLGLLGLTLLVSLGIIAANLVA